jgi:hypothetical protein
MIQKLLELFGLARLVVMAVTLGAVGAALHEAGAGGTFTGVVLLLLVLAFLYAPFGAKYRRW